MLPHRSDRYSFSTALIAGLFLATASWGQSFNATDATLANSPDQPDEASIGGKFDLGDATIGFDLMSIFDRLDRESDLSIKREESSSANFSLKLSDDGGSYLIPEALNFSARKTDMFGQTQIFPQFYDGSIVTPDLSGLSKSDYMISVDWGAPEDKYSFSFSSSYSGERLDAGEFTDTHDDMLNFTRTLRTGGWLSSFTASVGRGYRDDTGTRERSKKIGASANFKTRQKGSPYFDITARVLQDRTSKLAAPGSGDVDTRWELRTGSKILGATSRDDLTIQPSLSIFFSVKGNSPDEEDEDTKEIDFSAGLSGKVHF